MFCLYRLLIYTHHPLLLFSNVNYLIKAEFYLLTLQSKDKLNLFDK